ncbi:MAG: hypothetical protein M1816_007874 [Peltula sp. TS41687]|nr:MAG: hypothetical protein M1816_007874 [Peltula sp. TS41687]
MITQHFYSFDPPPPRTLEQNKPTLLVSWWCTGFAITIILFRLCGRFIRMEQLFREDKIMALAILPILFRMGLVHVVLLWGTNNTITDGLSFEDIHHREIGSGLVLASRVMYAAVLWLEKYSIAEALYRLVSQAWTSTYEKALKGLRWVLLLTFLGVVVSTIGECHPFRRYWQVLPDPGPQCRLGYAQLATMGSTNVITDLILVSLPIPIIVRSNMCLKRKISLVLLFALSLGPIAVTLYRIPTIVARSGNQQFRSLCASFEILVATGASNALALGSFVRDRGPKKKRFKFGSASDSLSRPSTRREGRLPHWDSDEDLVRGYGMTLDPERGSLETTEKPRPAPIAVPGRAQTRYAPPDPNMPDWPYPSPDVAGGGEMDIQYAEAARAGSSASGSMLTPRRVTFFDVGGLLEDDTGGHRTPSASPIIDLYADSSSVVGQEWGHGDHHSGSRVLLQDMGGIIPSSPSPNAESQPPATLQEPSQSRRASKMGSSKPLPDPPSSSSRRSRSSFLPNSPLSRSQNVQPLQDVGGLLSR